MEKKSIKALEVFTSEEEQILVWENVQKSFEKNFGTEVYTSWLKNISLLKEYHDYLVLGVPTRFFRDWIVSRYLDKILSQLKTFKNSIVKCCRITCELKQKLCKRIAKPRRFI